MPPITHCSLLSLAGPATTGQRTLGLIYQVTLIPSPSDRCSPCAEQIRPGCSGCCPSACDGGVRVMVGGGSTSSSPAAPGTLLFPVYWALAWPVNKADTYLGFQWLLVNLFLSWLESDTFITQYIFNEWIKPCFEYK